ncbi:hypothetical protein [Deinococcus ruber]|uniref:Uncharacterized protein n=1 Tax=Deinococcus ruber TaxID=1848197 RepID=A0A918C6W8_9DEIO|nr:hypothetical protein [Deinococcus ruber]GGR09746.1 hypothetical protein GCM10008957_23130 [Deinococcus ruber]
MEETAVPVYSGSIAKMGLDSREDFGITLMLAAGVYELVKSVINYGLKDLIAVVIAGAVWRLVIVPGMRAYRQRFPPKYVMHWIRSRVLLAPVLHCRPDTDPRLGVLPDPPVRRP